MPWQAVVFDLDDTLYPERQYVFSGMRAVAVWAQRELGFPPQRSFAELRGLFESGARGDTFDRWLRQHGLASQQRVASMVRVYRGHQPRIMPFAHARDLLRRLGRHCRLGLVTDGYLETQQRKVAALGLADCFQAIVYSDRWGRRAWKPSPRPFQAVLRRLAVEPGYAVYVADNPAKDFCGARLVGMATIRLRHPDGLYRQLEPACADDAPDAEIRVIAELETALDKLAPPAIRPIIPSRGPKGGHEAA
jgi:putative hydrolase of the HAD superfamily